MPARRVDDAHAELTEKSSLRDLADAVPGLRDELIERSRGSGLLAGVVGILVVPTWTVVDRISAPAHVTEFLLVRLLVDALVLLCLVALWRLPVGRRFPERLTFLLLATIQVGVAWIIPRVDDVQYYLLGYTLVIYACGGVLATRPRWTARLIGVSWAALALFVITAPVTPAAAELVAASIHLGSASVIALLAHLRRYAINNRELATRVRLEREQERSRVLLATLERLSQEDPLTGLANRRRWDTELAAACAEARGHDGVVSLVLLDIDRFKQVNDRHGHAGGDEALRAVAALLRGRVRAGDLVARLGGDELGVLMPGAHGERARALAELLREQTALTAPEGFTPGELTLSLGVASVRGEAAFPLELIARADQQLYRAKITRNAVGAPSDDNTPTIPVPRPAPPG
jgi:diguanylate cyclase (GGDEF)-like protein